MQLESFAHCEAGLAAVRPRGLYSGGRPFWLARWAAEKGAEKGAEKAPQQRVGIWMTGRLKEWPTIVMVPSDDDAGIYYVKVFTLDMQWEFCAHGDDVLDFIADEMPVFKSIDLAVHISDV